MGRAFAREKGLGEYEEEFAKGPCTPSSRRPSLARASC